MFCRCIACLWMHLSVFECRHQTCDCVGWIGYNSCTYFRDEKPFSAQLFVHLPNVLLLPHGKAWHGNMSCLPRRRLQACFWQSLLLRGHCIVLSRILLLMHRLTRRLWVAMRTMRTETDTDRRTHPQKNSKE